MNVSAFIGVLPYILKGMLGIFAVTAVIIICIVILNKTTEAIEKRKGDDSQNTTEQ